MKSPLVSLLLAVALLFWGVAGAWAGTAEPSHSAHAAEMHHGTDCTDTASQDAEPGGLIHGCCVAACSVVMDAVQAPAHPDSGRRLAVYALMQDDAASLPALPLRRPPRARA